MEIRELTTDDEIQEAFPVAKELRTHLKPGPFMLLIRRQQADGYRLYGGYVDSKLVVIAGVRDAHTLAKGRHLFVDDLITTEGERGKGYATRMLRWLAEEAHSRDIPRLYLDSRDTAVSYYEKVGFKFLTAVPCWISTSHFRKVD